MREAARRAWRAFSGSLSAKVFAGLFCLLSAAGLALYAGVAAAFRRSHSASVRRSRSWFVALLVNVMAASSSGAQNPPAS